MTGHGLPEEDQRFPLRCGYCNKYESGRYAREARDEMSENQACFNCNFWLEKIRWREREDPRAVVTSTFKHYRIGPDMSPNDRSFGGFGGRRFVVTFHDGREVTTTNLWHQGTVPEHFRDRLQPNAELKEGSP